MNTTNKEEEEHKLKEVTWINAYPSSSYKRGVHV